MSARPEKDRAQPSHLGRSYRVREFFRRLGEKCNDDEVLFMAGAIAFNIIVALLPLLLLGIGLASTALARFGDPSQALLGVATSNLPQGAGLEMEALIDFLTVGVLEQRTNFTTVGAIFLIVVATRLSGSLRVALREIFDIGSKRTPLRAIAFDVVGVVVGGVLLTLNLGVTVVFEASMSYGLQLFGLSGATVSFAQRALGFGLAFTSIWILLYLLYRFVPARQVSVRTAVIAATFSAISHESLKFGFSWYATEVADYGSMFGNVATVMVLFFWIYYESLVFILGGEVAQVSTMRKASRVGVVNFGDSA